MRIVITPRLAPALSTPVPEPPELPRLLWEALLVAPNHLLTGERRALR
jgi:hypothetical protein